MHPRELASSICGTLKNAGFQAFLVGGCVRDLLLKLEPADYDVATSATPDEVLRLFPEGLAVGAQFGVTLGPRDGMKVGVGDFRPGLRHLGLPRPRHVELASSPRDQWPQPHF